MCGFGNVSQRALESFGKIFEILTGDPVRTLNKSHPRKNYFQYSVIIIIIVK
jgi:hypothetical protein